MTSKPELCLRSYRPRPRVVLKQTTVARPRFPAIDAHNHLGEMFGGGWDGRPVRELLDVLDEAQVRMLVDLDGGWSEALLHAHLDHFKAASPERFRVCGGVDWAQWPSHANRFGEWAAGQLQAQARRGAQGLKIWKPFGLHVVDQHGARVRVDDVRLDPLWQTAAELQLPVMIHIADPLAFFDPIDETNERWEELGEHPDWHFPSPPFPSFMSLVESLFNLVSRHPNTTFIGAHVGCFAENLEWVGQMLERCPNYFVDISARLGELGRQPYSARRFCLRYADRILFGVDSAPRVAEYQLYYRFLETDDEYFAYALSAIPPQGRWQIYGLYLPDEVLEKVYYGNAARIFGLT